MLVNGKRKWPDALRHRYEELVNSVVNTLTLVQGTKATETDTVVGGSGLEPLTPCVQSPIEPSHHYNPSG